MRGGGGLAGEGVSGGEGQGRTEGSAEGAGESQVTAVSPALTPQTLFNAFIIKESSLFKLHMVKKKTGEQMLMKALL